MCGVAATSWAVLGEEYLTSRCHPTSLVLSGAMLDSCSMPCGVDGWSSSAFGVLGAQATSSFRWPLCCQRSVRLFLGLVTGQQSLSDDQRGVSVGVSFHATLRAVHQRGTRGIAFCWLACIIASKK